MAPSMETPAVEVASGYVFALTLERLPPMEALHLAATTALSDTETLRLALADALCWLFPLVGDDVVLDHLPTRGSRAPRRSP